MKHLAQVSWKWGRKGRQLKGLSRESACCANVMIWVWIPSTHAQSKVWALLAYSPSSGEAGSGGLAAWVSHTKLVSSVFNEMPYLKKKKDRK